MRIKNSHPSPSCQLLWTAGFNSGNNQAHVSDTLYCIDNGLPDMNTPPASRETPIFVLEPNIWQETYHIRTYEVDCHNRLSIPSMFNVSFVEWVVEGVPSSLLRTSALVQLEINFLAEAFYEDCILAACHPGDPDNGVYHHSLFRRQDGRELARARSVWRPA